MAYGKPEQLNNDFKLRTETYARDGIYTEMTSSEMLHGKNNTGEVETPLGSIPDTHTENWVIGYLNQHIMYLYQLVAYLASKANISDTDIQEVLPDIFEPTS